MVIYPTPYKHCGRVMKRPFGKQTWQREFHLFMKAIYTMLIYIYICILYMYVYIYVTYTGAVDIYLSIDIELYTYIIYIIYYIYIIYIHAQNRTFALSPHLSHTKWCSFSTDPVPVSLRDGLLPRVSFRNQGPRVPWCFTLCTLWLFVT